MGKSKFVRTVGALLMILAMVVPVAPAAAATTEDPGDVHAANVLGSPTAPAIDVQDCIGSPTSTNDGQSRYFITVRSTSGLDVTNAVGRLVTTGFSLGAPFNLTVPAQVVTMSNGDFESQANDGNQPACVPAVNDGHANDLASPPTGTFPATAPIAIGTLPAGAPLWNMVITAGGFVPVVIPITVDDSTPTCSLNDGRICLISFGTVNLQPLSAPAGRGTIAGSVFASNGQPLDGATIVLTDASGLVHTRTSGTNCDRAPIGGAAPTG